MKNHWVHLSIRQLGILLAAPYAKNTMGVIKGMKRKQTANPSQIQARLFLQQSELLGRTSPSMSQLHWSQRSGPLRWSAVVDKPQNPGYNTLNASKGGVTLKWDDRLSRQGDTHQTKFSLFCWQFNGRVILMWPLGLFQKQPRRASPPDMVL